MISRRFRLGGNQEEVSERHTFLSLVVLVHSKQCGNFIAQELISHITSSVTLKDSKITFIIKSDSLKVCTTFKLIFAT